VTDGRLEIGERRTVPAADIDRLSDEDFRVLVAPLFETAPGFLQRLVAARPFGSLEGMFERAREIAHAMPEQEQVELIDAHPRLGAPPGSVSAMSFGEQGYDREEADARADAERARVDRELAQLNEAYEERFGFRYCVFVAGRPREALLPAFRDALDADRDAELRRALDAVVDIARDRSRTLSRAQEAG
jgi:2-oxo-4-hydroxy-4-carboxy--5-ureidoimidazoline (OHCU) decarboxylase